MSGVSFAANLTIYVAPRFGRKAVANTPPGFKHETMDKV
jgi:hypothetical protein